MLPYVTNPQNIHALAVIEKYIQHSPYILVYKDPSLTYLPFGIGKPSIFTLYIVFPVIDFSIKFDPSQQFLSHFSAANRVQGYRGPPPNHHFPYWRDVTQRNPVYPMTDPWKNGMLFPHKDI